jgi:hypothetical protein
VGASLPERFSIRELFPEQKRMHIMNHLIPSESALKVLVEMEIYDNSAGLQAKLMNWGYSEYAARITRIVFNARQVR